MFNYLVPLLLATSVVVISYNQSDYEVIIERAATRNLDPRYIRTLLIENIKYNRTVRAVNMTFMFARDIKSDFDVRLQAYKFVSNEYRVFPMHFTTNLCKSLQTNTFGLRNLLDCGNFTTCSYKKDTIYKICNWTPLSEKFPPHIPEGRYLLNFELMLGSISFAIVEGYANFIYKH